LYEEQYLKTITAKLIAQTELAPEVHHFEFEVSGRETFHFTPGQFVSVIEHADGKEITRAYSIASPRDGNRFELCLNRVEDGIVSPYLFDLKPGDEVEMGEPLGYFTLRHPGRRAVFVATGTGIAPFRSMLLDHLPKTQPRITLLFGVRYERGLLYRAEFERLEREYSSFRFIPTLTRPDSAWAGKTGRVQAH
jgi:ferredoxin-NADP reductase